MDDISDTAFYLGLIVIAIVVLLAAIFLLSFATTPRSPCWDTTSQACIDYRIDQCMITERYTLDQCVTLIGGGK